jgi:polyisoprenyl-phosphate glycosyltransferase
MKLSIILPCYNEEKNIPLILEKFNNCIITEDIELILVNNGSSDNSENVLKKLLPKYSFARTVKIEINEGYGYGVVQGLNSSKGEFVCYTHADMQTDPGDVLKGLEIIKNSSDSENCFIKGDRKGRGFFDQFFTIGMSVFETLYMRTTLWDINAQPNLFHRNFFKSLDNIPKDFSLDLFFLFMAKKKGLNIIRFDVIFPPRIHGVSSWNVGLSSRWKFIKRTINFSTKLKKEL